MSGLPPATEAEMAALGDLCKAEVAAWTSQCPPDAQEKSMGRPKEDYEAEFEATWGAADTNQDGLLDEAEFLDFTAKMKANEKAFCGFALDQDEATIKAFYAAILSLSPGAEGVSKEVYTRYYAVQEAVYTAMQ